MTKKKVIYRKGGKVPPAKKDEVRYRRELQGVINSIWGDIKQLLLPVLQRHKGSETIQDSIQDGFIEEALAAIAAIKANHPDAISAPMAETFVNAVSGTQNFRFQNMVVNHGFNLSMKRIIASEKLQGTVNASIASNTELINNMKQEYIGKVAEAVTRNFTTGEFSRKNGGLTAEIRRLTKVSKNRADLIALDQTHKLTATLNQVRNESLGVIGYQWRTVKDKAVRGNPIGLYPNAKFNHWDREGKYYLYRPMNKPPLAPDGKPFRQPPKDGAPGQSIRCRCSAVPVIPNDLILK